jgi:hypothetical protein
MFLTSLPLKSPTADETWSSVIAKCVLGNCFATVASESAIRKPAAITRCAFWRTAVVRFGM